MSGYFETQSNQYTILAHIASIDEKLDHIMMVLRMVAHNQAELLNERVVNDDNDTGRTETGGEVAETCERAERHSAGDFAES